MAGSIFGKCFTITTWGESHGPALGVVIDGCPAGLPLKLPISSAGWTGGNGQTTIFHTPGKKVIPSVSFPVSLKGAPQAPHLSDGGKRFSKSGDYSQDRLLLSSRPRGLYL